MCVSSEGEQTARDTHVCAVQSRERDRETLISSREIRSKPKNVLGFYRVLLSTRRRLIEPIRSCDSSELARHWPQRVDSIEAKVGWLQFGLAAITDY